MANYYGSGRSNSVKLTDVEKAKKIAALYSLELTERQNDLWVFTCGNDNESGDIDRHYYNLAESDEDALKEVGIEVDESEGDVVELPDFMKTISKFLHPDYVLVWQHVGNEKLRYLSGYAIAVNSKGKIVSVDIDDIYKKANKLGKEITLAQY